MVGGDLAVCGNLYLDLSGFGLLVPGQVHFEDSIFELGGHRAVAGVRRERETMHNSPVGAFAPVIPLAVPLEFPVACDGQRALFHVDLHVLLLHLRQLSLDQVPFGVFADIHQREPLGHLVVTA